MKEYIVRVYSDRTDWRDKKGNLHREGGPAVECADGTKEWWQNGKRHREDGPAVEFEDGSTEWWLNGQQLPEEEFNQQMNSCDGKTIVIDGKEYKLTLIK